MNKYKEEIAQVKSDHASLKSNQYINLEIKDTSNLRMLSQKQSRKKLLQQLIEQDRITM